MKKILSLVLAIMMIFSLAITAFANEDPILDEPPVIEKVTLTIRGYKTGHEYEAYQLFSGTVNGGVLEGIDWGKNVRGEDLLAALKASNTDIVNPNNPSQVTNFADEFKNAENAVDVAGVMKSWDSNGIRLDTFAKFVETYLTGAPAESEEATDDSKTYSFELDPGYYLIKDKDSNDILEEDFYTKFVITLTSNTEATVKGSVPTVSKEVSHNLGSNYTDEITNELQKTHYYRWVGSISADIDDYDHYHYEFIDTMSAGLTFLHFEEIYIRHTGDKYTMIYNAAEEEQVIRDDLMPDEMEAEVGSDGVTTVTVKWENLLENYPTLLASDHIVVKYSAVLNGNAIVGQNGNENEVYLVYSNDPSGDGQGKTKPVDPRVYTLKLDVLKQDEVTKQPLDGAKFVLYQYDTDTQTDALTAMYAIMNVVDGVNKISDWTDVLADATELTSDENGKILVDGIQSDIDYYLKETAAPTNYNLLTKDVKFMITKVTYGTDEYIESMVYEVDGASKTVSGDTGKLGTIHLTVNNKSGTTLPSTGGVGTTLFYVIGGVMVAAALVLLVTKKRMNAEN